MHWRLGRMLFWTAIGLVAAAFVLALVGEKASSTNARELILHWHEWLGLLSLVAIVVALAARQLGKYAGKPPLPNWLPRLRRAVRLLLYTLLILQPLSGWLLASHEGKLASFFRWILPPLAAPNSALGHLGYIYHGLGGMLILFIVALSLRLNLTALVFSATGQGRRDNRETSGSEKPDSRHPD